MYGIILTIDIIAAIAIVVLVLLQQGKGANMGVSFGAGASSTVFGSKGAASFLFKMTVFFTAVFFVSCLTLGYLGKSSAITANISTANTDSSIASQYDQYQKEVSQAGTADTSKQASK
ncbi:preprotein translocase subunit SecG [Francisella tularensis]|uniref:Protein-export membrane protein SecG n=3 Tax=Francisella tularensis TaxID=263 RepID=Q5NII6_FRATT|nr:preprotein translocase subunit SecG [Francisella tularensis]ACD30243.1 preprotein translocase, subunit G, membrane protein [Francisella tularensis subsp. mediasiatica FSC147]ABO46143.1 preprotein translocase, subunit G, membrane protein [Francisella tularensis subsp. tularensis WY96-3418]ADA77760.1 preprotein translocase subunit SecG [Francisella tularensis subsp. tularensis NE061598]AFB78217.1 Preprotein translocase subunit SecG [Francisella tularensis subsp. tularensis TIGB03]AFB79841.1 P